MSQKNPKLLLGAHLSIAGGLENALFNGQSIGCTCIQIFTHSNRQWDMKPITGEEINRFTAAQKQTGIDFVVVHASYLINPASPQTSTRILSLKTIIKELQRCEQLGIASLVLHPGAHLAGSEDDGINHLADCLDQALEAVPGNVSILIENMAGQGSSLGRRFEQLALIRAKAHHKKRIGICVDTCHLFAAGYDLSSPEKYETLWKDFDTTVGIEHLKALHLNDSKNKCGSHVDRHADIGKGTIGLEGFKLIMNDPRFVHIPKILETPKDSLDDDRRNLEALKGLIK